MLKIGIIIGSVRPGRLGESVGKWVYEQAKKRDDAEFELIDLMDYNLPLMDEPNLPAIKKYTKDHTKVWSAKIDEFDGYIIVTPEYNHSTSGALKNALDFLYQEWNNKAVGFVSYGAISGARAVESLRPMMAQFQMADVRAQVMLSNFTDFEDGKCKPHPRQEESAKVLFDQVIAWSNALKVLRK